MMVFMTLVVVWIGQFCRDVNLLIVTHAKHVTSIQITEEADWIVGESSVQNSLCDTKFRYTMKGINFTCSDCLLVDNDLV